MDKIFTFGHSQVDPYFFNTRIKGLAGQPDEYHFTKILSKVTGVDDCRVFSLSGTGNNWIASSVIHHLNDIDANSIVIINWGFVDRVDLVLSAEQDYLQSEIEDSINAEYEHLGFNKTFDHKGNTKESGLRYWPTAHYMFGPKMKLRELVSHATQLKDFYERVALVSRLLKEKKCKQIHFTQLDPEKYTFRDLIQTLKSYMISNSVNDATYRTIHLTSKYPAVEEHCNELVDWKNLVDDDLFLEHTFDFFLKNNIPYVCTDAHNNYHQPPINHYLYIQKVILPALGMPGNDILEEMRRATIEHCTRYNAVYPWDDELIKQIV